MTPVTTVIGSIRRTTERSVRRTTGTNCDTRGGHDATFEEMVTHPKNDRDKRCLSSLID